MNKLLPLILIFFASVYLWAQDDSIEELDAVVAETIDLKNENSFLEFESYFISAVQERVRENPAKALEYLQRCEAIYPEHPAMLFEKAKTYFALKNFNQAHYYCDRLLSEKQNFYWGKVLKKDLLVAEQNLQDALTIQKQLYKENPNEASELLRLYIRMKDIQAGRALLNEIDARAIYVPGIEGYKRFFGLPNVLDDVESNEDDDKLDETQERVTNHIDDVKNEVNHIYETLINDNDFHQLFSTSQQNMYKNPTEPLHYFYNGMALHHLNKSRDAAEVLEMGLDFVFDNKDLKLKFFNQLISIYTVLKNEGKVKYYRELVRQL